MKKVIELTAVSKSYGRVQALDKISFDVEEGSIFGFLGPNGAGKSTTIGILLQFLSPNSGQIHIFGEDIKGNTDIKRRIAVIPDADLPKINGVRLLRHTGRYYGYEGQELKTHLNQVVRLTKIRSFVNRSTATYSKGQKTRLKIANALMSNPDLIIADEPTSGLDPLARRDFLDLTLDLVKDQGKTVFFSSHVIGDVEKVCDMLVILNEGRVVTQGSLHEITSNLGTSNAFVVTGKGMSESLLTGLEGVIEVSELSRDRFVVKTENSIDQTPSFLHSLTGNPKVTLQSFTHDSLDLERLFMKAIDQEVN